MGRVEEDKIPALSVEEVSAVVGADTAYTAFAGPTKNPLKSRPHNQLSVYKRVR